MVLAAHDPCHHRGKHFLFVWLLLLLRRHEVLNFYGSLLFEQLCAVVGRDAEKISEALAVFESDGACLVFWESFWQAIAQAQQQ